MANIVPINYNLITESYSEFINNLRHTLADHNDRQDVCNRPVLPKQCAKQPARWIYINLEGKPNDRTTLAVRDDNLYLIGFRNNRGEWYEFGYSNNTSAQVLPEPSIFLECDVRYSSMVGDGGAFNLRDLKLGLRFAIDAVGRLSGHAKDADGTGRADGKVKRGLARLIVKICEAARMTPHYRRVEESMRAYQMCKYINKNEVFYLLNWGKISAALLEWDVEGWDGEQEANYWPRRLRKIGIQGSGKALDIVYLLLNKPPPVQRGRNWRHQRMAAGGDDRSDDQPPAKRSRSHHQQTDHHQQQQQQPPPPPPPPPGNTGRGRSHRSDQLQEAQVPHGAGDSYECDGRPLVEVFGVRAVDFLLVGRIVVFDGIRGQIIYHNSAVANDNSAPPGDGVLLMTGPYTAISGCGSFTIEVDIPDPSTQCKSSDVGELNWDCYNKDNMWDELICDTITTKSGRKVEVAYAVMSDAVEVNVEVRLHLPRGTVRTRVYGRITARSESLFGSDDKACIVLFDSQVRQAKAVTDGSPLPLARSVVAMPVGSPLVIKATLYDADHAPAAGIQGESPIFQHQHIMLTLGDGTTMKRLSTNNGGEVEVTITSPDCGPAAPTSTPTTTPNCSQFVCP